MTEPFSDKQQLKAFINAAQYIAGLTSSQDIWEEAGKVLLRFFGADFVAFGRYDADGNIEIGRRLFSGDSASVLLLEQELKTAARDVFDSGFLSRPRPSARHIRSRLREPAECAARGHRSDEDARIGVMIQHADAVAQNRAAGVRAGRIHRDDAHPFGLRGATACHSDPPACSCPRPADR